MYETKGAKGRVNVISDFFFVVLSVAAALRIVERIVLCLLGETFSKGPMQRTLLQGASPEGLALAVLGFGGCVPSGAIEDQFLSDSFNPYPKIITISYSYLRLTIFYTSFNDTLSFIWQK